MRLTGEALTANKTVSLPVSSGKSKPLSKPALRVARKKISYISYQLLDARRHCFGKDRLQLAQQELSELCAYAESAGCYGMIEDDLKKLEDRLAQLDASPNDVSRPHLALVQR